MNARPLQISWSNFAGLNNRVPVYEVPQIDTRYTNKPPSLSKACNVDVDSQGRVRRRPGYSLQIPGSFHSLYSVGNLCVAVKGADLVKINSDMTTLVIRSGVGTAPMAYDQMADYLVYSNEVAIGYLSMDGTDHGFAAPDLIFKVAPFPGSHIAWYKGRLYIAKNNVLFFTDAVALRIDMRKNFIQFPSAITLVKAVDGGIFISDEERMYFIAGDQPEKTELLIKEDAAVSGTGVVVMANIFKAEWQGKALVFATKNGICLGMGDGQVRNLTVENYVMPDVAGGSSIIQDLGHTQKLTMSLYN